MSATTHEKLKVAIDLVYVLVKSLFIISLISFYSYHLMLLSLLKTNRFKIFKCLVLVVDTCIVTSTMTLIFKLTSIPAYLLLSIFLMMRCLILEKQQLQVYRV